MKILNQQEAESLLASTREGTQAEKIKNFLLQDNYKGEDGKAISRKSLAGQIVSFSTAEMLGKDYVSKGKRKLAKLTSTINGISDLSLQGFIIRKVNIKGENRARMAGIAVSFKGK